MKSILTLKYLLGLDWTRLNANGKPPNFYYRADDDVYINIPAVHETVIVNPDYKRFFI
jgi:hypothetical protein